MAEHAVLSPSAAERWLNCTPSARLEQQFPDNSSKAASEGTLAHSLGELIIRQRISKITKAVYAKDLAIITANEQYDFTMFEYADDYAVFVLEQFAEAQAHTKDALLFLEQKLNLTDYVPEGFGTGDTIIIADTVLTLIDFKYGKGVPVTALNNKQMMLYSIGALREYDYMYDIQTVRMIIYQPRLDSITTFEMSVTDLKQWAESELKPRATLAFAGTGEFSPGSHCRFCKANAVCKANAEFNLQLARYDFAEATLLTDAEISDIMDRTDAFITWLNAIDEYALNEAVHNNKKWPGYKLVEGRSNRVYSSEEKVAEALTAAGYKEETIYSKKLIGITAMEKAITKAAFNTHLGALVIKPAGKPCLAPKSDKRPELNSVETAKTDFAEMLDI